MLSKPTSDQMLIGIARDLREQVLPHLTEQPAVVVMGMIDQILRNLIPEGSRSEWRDASGEVSLCEMHPHSGWYGRAILLIDELTPARVAFVTRLGVGIIPDEHTVLQEGDLIHVMVAEADTARVEAILAQSPEGERS